MTGAILFLLILIVFVAGIAIVELSDEPGNNIFDQKRNVRRRENKRLRKENEELLQKVAELERYRQDQDLVLNWIDPRLKELTDGTKEQ